MDFRLNQEQQMLRDSARRYIESEQHFENRRQHVAGKRTDSWSQLAELGWLSLLAPEDVGGLGGKLEDLVILSEEIGRGLLLAPFIGGAILPMRIIDRSGSAQHRNALLPAMATNQTRVAVAVYEPGRRYELCPDARAVCLSDGSYRLTGSKILVSGGGEADRLIVSAQVESGPAIFLVSTDRAGVSRRVYQTLDDAEATDFGFDAVAVSAAELLVGPATALTLLEDSLDDAIICLCAETLGCMERAIELTAGYLKIRTQFGRPLADFQALQHTMAEMFIEANNARSMLYRALAAKDTARHKAISGCKIKVLQAAKWVTGTAIHLHGAIGVTSEYPVGHCLRRVTIAERTYGDAEHHFQRYLAQGIRTA